MTATSDGTGGQSDVLALQMEALYKSAPASILSIAGALMALVAYWAPGMESRLILWLGCVTAIALVHIASAILHGWGRPARWTATAWARLVQAIYLASGLSWGIGGAWMLGQGDEQQALVICCLAMGAVTVTFSAVVYVPAYNLFQAPIFICYAVGLATSDLHYGWLLAIASALLCAALAAIAAGIGGQLVLSLRLADENGRLAARLEQRGADLEAANRELEDLSLTDPLTGLANRRHLMKRLRDADADRAFLIVDIDHFKAYNDSFGHIDGDTCLGFVARAIEAGARPGRDLVARLGGEEFAVVLSGVDGEEAQAIAEAIRVGVEGLFAARPDDIRRAVTVSIGIAIHDPARHPTLVELMADADAAVYLAKQTGRNRVCRRSGDTLAAAVA